MMGAIRSKSLVRRVLADRLRPSIIHERERVTSLYSSSPWMRLRRFTPCRYVTRRYFHVFLLLYHEYVYRF